MKLIKAPNGWTCDEDPGEPGLGEPRWSIGEHEAYFLAEMFRGLAVLEIGTGLGISTNAIAKTARQVFTVDIDPWVADNIAPMLDKNVIFLNDIKNAPEVDAAFVDGLHSYRQCAIDIEDCKRLVNKGGIIILHDAKMEGVLRAANESGIRFYEVVTHCGLAIGWNYAKKSE